MRRLQHACDRCRYEPEHSSPAHGDRRADGNGHYRGRAYLASCSAAEQRKLIECLLAHGEKRNVADLRTMTDLALDSLRIHGYCTSIHEWREGVTGVAVPLYLKHFGRRLVLTCGGSARQLTPEFIVEGIAPLLKQTATDIEAACEQLGRR